jgi:hypothetical protein
MEKISAYRRGVLYGIVASQKMVMKELHSEIENQKLNNTDLKKQYDECCAFMGIIFIQRFQKFMVDMANSWEKENG